MPSTGNCMFLTGRKARASIFVLALFVAVLPSISSMGRSMGLSMTLEFDRLGAEDVIIVRVLASESPKTIVISSGASDLYVIFDDDPSYSSVLQRGRQMSISVSGTGLELRHPTLTRRASSIKVESSAGRSLSISGENLDERAYLGQLEFHAHAESGTLRILNTVNIEEYVSSVVASEYGLHDVEGAKAMAVVARTYALRSRYMRSTRRNTSGSWAGSEYDLLDDTRAQVYRGEKSVTTQSRRAANETAGETLFYDGSLIQALYSSSNGGKTAANESIWSGEPVPYLRGRDDPYDAVSPHSTWRVEIDRNSLHSALSDRFGLRVVALEFTSTGKDGRVRDVKLIGDKGNEKMISGGVFRAVASARTRQLKSTYFDVEQRGKKYRFNGHGFGHGVGLSQWGAHGMALDGSSYGDILGFYYPGTTLEGPGPQQFDKYLAASESIRTISADPEYASGEVSEYYLTSVAAGGKTSKQRRVQLGWGGGWKDLHTDAALNGDAVLRTKERSVGVEKSRDRRVGW